LYPGGRGANNTLHVLLALVFLALRNTRTQITEFRLHLFLGEVALEDNLKVPEGARLKGSHMTPGHVVLGRLWKTSTLVSPPQFLHILDLANANEIKIPPMNIPIQINHFFSSK
jgi:hypothetical protein